MIISEYIEVKITKHNIDWYKTKGYEVELKDKITVHWLNDLPPLSKKELDFQCDYCNCLFKRPKSTWFHSNEKACVKKDACPSCRGRKTKESNLLTYGTENVAQVKEFKEKSLNTMIEKYGVRSPLQNKEILAKFKATNNERYGGNSPSHSDEILEKIKRTNLERYGSEYYVTSVKGKEKIESTLMERYGTIHFNKIDGIQEKREQTMNKRYGVSNPFKMDGFKDDLKLANLEKYGVEHYFQSEDFKVKSNKTNLERYGDITPSKNEDIKKKIKKTTIDRYGDDFYLKTLNKAWKTHKENGTDALIYEKRKKTNLEKYGHEYVCQVEEFKTKRDQTNLQRYGVENVMKNPLFVEKAKQTNLDRYGKDNPMKVEEFKMKLMQTLYQNGTAPTSRQQTHIHELVQGELNYPVGRCFLDIAFVDEKIYLEYDGGGHELQITFGKLTQEEFNKKERNRSYYLSHEGWKEIRIITEDDKLPSDDLIKDFVDITKSFFNEDKGFSVRWNLNFNEVLVNYKHTYSITEFIENNKVSEEI